jgi:Zn-dependent metalloprotease
MMTYDYFKQIHGRNSYDNNGSVIKNYVHYSTNYVNASWNSLYERMTYGDGNGTTVDAYVCLDVVGHEIGHGVCQYTANLVYQGEPGAINEGISDIWGACIENYVNIKYNLNKDLWLHREEVGTPNRSLSNPNSFGQPDTYGAPPYWINPSSGTDYGGVHTNSGIMNYWFYLLSVGKTGTNYNGNSYNIASIGINKAEKILYRAESVYMTSNTNFSNARSYTIQAALDLYGHCSPEVANVTNAWYAVGVGSQYIATQTISNVTYVYSTTINACCNLLLDNVKIQSGAKLTLDANEVRINGPFEVEFGSQFEF